MKTASRLLLPLALSAVLVSCEDAKNKAAQAAAEAKAAAEKAAAEAGPTVESLKAKAAEALKEADAASGGALSKTKDALGDAAAKAKDAGAAALQLANAKFGVPEVDTILEGIDKLIEDTRAAVHGGLNSAKAKELKAKWNSLEAAAREKMANLAPEKKEELTTTLANLKTYWEGILARASGAEAKGQ